MSYVMMNPLTLRPRLVGQIYQRVNVEIATAKEMGSATVHAFASMKRRNIYIAAQHGPWENPKNTSTHQMT